YCRSRLSRRPLARELRRLYSTASLLLADAPRSVSTAHLELPAHFHTRLCPPTLSPDRNVTPRDCPHLGSDFLIGARVRFANPCENYSSFDCKERFKVTRANLTHTLCPLQEKFKTVLVRCKIFAWLKGART